MAALLPMPAIDLSSAELAAFGTQWHANGEKLKRSKPWSSLQLGDYIDSTVGTAVAEMLGRIPILKPSPVQLQPSGPDCVEVGPVRIIGGVRPQNFDVGYRPDGVRIAFDSKTLNDLKSVRKNYQNMINDLATEATTVHSRFPYAIVAFLVAIPKPCLVGAQKAALIGTLERLGRRNLVDEPEHLAEALALVVWDPDTGTIDSDIPDPKSVIRVENFSTRVESAYVERYKGLPPHARDMPHEKDYDEPG